MAEQKTKRSLSEALKTRATSDYPGMLKAKSFSVSIPSEAMVLLRDYFSRCKLNRSEVVRAALAEFIDRHPDGV